MSKPTGSESSQSRKSRRALSIEQLDDVSGGGGPTPQQIATQNQMKNAAVQEGFDVSQLHLDAASMASGQTAQDFANEVGVSQGSVASAMPLLEALAKSDNVDIANAEEIDMALLEAMHVAGSRFDRLLKKLSAA